MKRQRILSLCLWGILLALLLAACGGQAEEQSSTPPEVTDSQIEESPENELSFDLPEDYEETAKELATTFTLQWALAYRSHESDILKEVLDDYDDMIHEVRENIVTSWNNSAVRSIPQYISGPTVSTVMVQDNYIENDAVHLTVKVYLTGTVQLFNNNTMMYEAPRGTNDRATYEMCYDSTGWQFKHASLNLG